MASNIPFHDQKEVYGVSEDCKFNDHPMCRSPRCGCSCHKASVTRVDHPVTGNSMAGSIQTGLDKYCPKCKVKAGSDQYYCTADGSKLSSLRCPECNTPGEESHVYCGHCGCSMKASDHQLEVAAIGPETDIESRIAEDSTDISADTINAEARMREAMDNKGIKRVAAPTRPAVNNRMFK